MRLKNFLIIVLVIFLVERLWPFFIPFQLPLFPVFAIIYLLTGVNFGRELSRIFVSALFFDVFSGLPFGLFTAAVVLVCLTVHYVKRWLVARGLSFFPGLIMAVLFFFEFCLLISISTSFPAFIAQLPMVLAGCVLAYLLLFIAAKPFIISQNKP